MKKVKDRFWLGVLSGLGGNAAKMAVEEIANRLGISSSKGFTQLQQVFFSRGLT